MRRKIFIFLVALGVLTLGVRFFVNQGTPGPNPSGVGLRFTEYAPLTPLSQAPSPLTPLSQTPSPLAELQKSVDQVSEAAIKGHWTTASRAVQQVEQNWSRLRPGEVSQLEIENEIERNIQTLQYNVWGKDQQGVLRTAKNLTNFISQLTGK